MEMYGIHHVGNFGNSFCGEAHKLICRNPIVGNESFCFRLEIVTTSTSIVGPHIGLYDAHVGKLGNIFSDAEVRKQNVGMRIGEEKAQAPSGKNQILKRLQKGILHIESVDSHEPDTSLLCQCENMFCTLVLVTNPTVCEQRSHTQTTQHVNPNEPQQRA